MKRAVITGPTGAVGVALIEELVRNDYFVYAIVRPGSRRIANIPKHKQVQVIACDLKELSSLPALIQERCELFFHLGWQGTTGAARDDMKLQLENIEYTLDAVDAAKALGCRRFIGAGSQAEYGRTEKRLNASVETFPENGYGIAKLCAGQMSRIRCSQEQMEHIWVRILSVYGPYDGKQSLVMSVIGKLLRGEDVALTKGEQFWDYIYAKDAARALLALAKAGKDQKTYCIGSGMAKPLREYIQEIQSRIPTNGKLLFGEIPYGANQVMHLCADISDLIEDTGFQANYSFEQGIAETIEWVKENDEKN